MIRLAPLFLFMLLIACGGGGSNNQEVSIGVSEEVFQEPVVEGKDVKISTLANVPAGDDAVWFLQMIHQGRKLGECKIEVVDSSGEDNIIGFSDEHNPFCDGVVIDPSSTSSNLKLEVQDQGIEYCVLIGGTKTCQEISMN